MQSNIYKVYKHRVMRWSTGKVVYPKQQRRAFEEYKIYRIQFDNFALPIVPGDDLMATYWAYILRNVICYQVSSITDRKFWEVADILRSIYPGTLTKKGKIRVIWTDFLYYYNAMSPLRYSIEDFIEFQRIMAAVQDIFLYAIQLNVQGTLSAIAGLAQYLVNQGKIVITPL
jgi:hypothetical protein